MPKTLDGEEVVFPEVVRQAQDHHAADLIKDLFAHRLCFRGDAVIGLGRDPVLDLNPRQVAKRIVFLCPLQAEDSPDVVADSTDIPVLGS